MKLSYWSIPGIQKQAVTHDSIVKAVCKNFNITKAQLVVKTRKREVVEARQVACVLMRKHFPRMSFGRIGTFLGGLDHATMIHAIGKVDNLLETDKDFNKLFNKITNEI